MKWRIEVSTSFSPSNHLIEGDGHAEALQYKLKVFPKRCLTSFDTGSLIEGAN